MRGVHAHRVPPPPVQREALISLIKAKFGDTLLGRPSSSRPTRSWGKVIARNACVLGASVLRTRDRRQLCRLTHFGGGHGVMGRIRRLHILEHLPEVLYTSCRDWAPSLMPLYQSDK